MRVYTFPTIFPHRIMKICGEVLVAKERGLPTIAALDDVGGDAREIKPGFSWHVTVRVTRVVERECRAVAA